MYPFIAAYWRYEMHPKPSKHLWPGETDISILGGNRDTKATLSGPFYGEILLVIICDLLCGSCPVGYGIYTGTQCFHHIARQRDIVVSNPGVALCPPRPRAVAGGRNSVLSSNSSAALPLLSFLYIQD